MKVLILAGGFAKRMGELGGKLPKSLLPVAGKPVIEHIIGKFAPLGIGDVYLSTNQNFERHFSGWASGFSGQCVKIIIEPSLEEGQKLGSVGALKFFIEKTGIDEDLLVIAGDNVFDFELDEYMEFCVGKDSFVFGVFDSKSIDEARKMGVVLMDDDGRVSSFEEKPQNPKSTLVSTGIYMFPKSVLPIIREYEAEGNSTDRMGDLLAWMMKRRTIYAFKFVGRWYDIGTPDTYRKADRDFMARQP